VEKDDIMTSHGGHFFVAALLVLLLWGLGYAVAVDLANVSIPCDAHVTTLTFNASNTSYYFQDCYHPLLHIAVSGENVSIHLSNVSIASLTIDGVQRSTTANITHLGNVYVSIKDSILDSCVGIVAFANITNRTSNFTRYDASLLISSDTASSAQVNIFQTRMTSCNTSAVNVSVGTIPISLEQSNESASASSFFEIDNSTVMSVFQLISWWTSIDQSHNSAVPVAAAAVAINNNAQQVFSNFSCQSSTLILMVDNPAVTLPTTSGRRPALHVLALGRLNYGASVLVADSRLLVQMTDGDTRRSLEAFIAPSNASLTAQSSCVSVRGTSNLPIADATLPFGVSLTWSGVSCSGGRLLSAGLTLGDGNVSTTSTTSSSLAVNISRSFFNDMRDGSVAGGGGIISCLHVVCLHNSRITIETVRAEWTRNSSSAANGSVSSLAVSSPYATQMNLANLSISVSCSEFIVSHDDVIRWIHGASPQHTAACIAIPAGSATINVTLENTRVVATVRREQAIFSTLTTNNSAISNTPNASEWSPTVFFYAIYVDGSTTQLDLHMRTSRVDLPLLQSMWSIVQVEVVNNESTAIVLGTGRHVFSQSIYAPINITITTDQWHKEYFGTLSAPPAIISVTCIYLTLLDDVAQSPAVRVDSGVVGNLGDHLPRLWRTASTATAETTASHSATKSRSLSAGGSSSQTLILSQSDQHIATLSSSISPPMSRTTSSSTSASISLTRLLPTTAAPPATTDPPSTTSGAPSTTTDSPPAAALPSSTAPSPSSLILREFPAALRRLSVPLNENPVAVLLFVEYSISRPRNGLECPRQFGLRECAGQLTQTLSGTETPSPSRTPSETLSPSLSASPSRSSSRRSATQSKSSSTFHDNVSARIYGDLSALALLTQSAELFLQLNGTWFPHWTPLDNCTRIELYPTSFNFSLGLGDANGLNDRVTSVGIAAASYIAQNATLSADTTLMGRLVVPPNSDAFRNIVDNDVTAWFFLDSRCTARGDKTLLFKITIRRIEPFMFQLDGQEYHIMQDVALAASVLSLAAALPVFALDVARITAPLNILRCTTETDVPLRHYQSFVPWQLIIDDNNSSDVQLAYYYGTIALIGIVWVGLFTMHVMFVGLFKVVTATTLLKGCIDGRFPSLLLSPFFALIQPMAMSVTTVVQNGAINGSLWLGVAGGVLCISACAAVTLRHICCFSSISDDGAAHDYRSLPMRMILGASFWNDHPDEDILRYTDRHRAWFGALKGRWHWVFLVEMWLSVFIGVLEGIDLGESRCIPLVWAAGVLFVLRMLFHVIARPYDAPLWTVGVVLLSATQALLCASIVAYDWIDISDQATRGTIQDVGEWDMRVSTYLVLVFCVLGLVKLLLKQFVDTAEDEYRAARAVTTSAIPQLGSMAHDVAAVLRLVDDICDEIAEQADAYDPALHKAFVSAHLELMLPGCEEDAEHNLLEILREFDVAALESGNKKLFTSSMEQLFEQLATKYSTTSANDDMLMLREEVPDQEHSNAALHHPQESTAVLRSPQINLQSAMHHDGSSLSPSPTGVHATEVELQEFSPSNSSPVRPLSLPRRGSMVEREQLNRGGLSYDQRQQFLDEMLQDTYRSHQHTKIEL
jgi:hypothetical protein